MMINQIGASAGYTFAYWALDSSLYRFLWSIERLSELGYRQFSLEILEAPHAAIYGPENTKRLLFFFQAEDGIRDGHVTGVQTCALPISTKKSDISIIQFVVEL